MDDDTLIAGIMHEIRFQLELYDKDLSELERDIRILVRRYRSSLEKAK